MSPLIIFLFAFVILIVTILVLLICDFAKAAFDSDDLEDE